jgi:hypothetical protein
MLVALLLMSAQIHVEGLDDISGFDKVEHFGANVVIVDSVWAAAAFLDEPVWVRIVLACAAGAAVSLGKEGYDLAGYGDPSLGDLVYDGFGIGAGVGFALAVEALAARYGDHEPAVGDVRTRPR